MPALLSDLTAAAADLKRDDPVGFGDSPALAQSFGLFICSFSCGALVGPILAGVLKARVGWGAAMLMLGLVCAFASVPVVSINPPKDLNIAPPQNRLKNSRWIRCFRC